MPCTKTMSEISELEYRQEIDELAQQIVSDMQEYPEDYNDLSEIVWEICDSHQWVIYTSYNLDVLKHCENEPNEFTHMIDDSMGYREILNILAYQAMESDVYFKARELAESENLTV